MVEEVREAHPGRQRVEVAELRRQVLRRRHQALVHQLAQGAHVFQGGLAAEQQGDLFELALAHGELDVVVDEDEALQVGQVLGERQAIRGRAAEDPAGVLVAVLQAVALLAIEVEHVEEIGALLGHVDRPGAIGQLAQAGRVGGEGDHLHQDRQAFLGHGGGRRPLGEEGADRLAQAVQGGADVHQALVDLQRAHVALVEQGVGAHLDVVGAGRRVGDDAVGLEHADGALLLAEHGVQPRLEDRHDLLGGQGLGFVLEIAAVGDVVQVVGEHQAEVGQGRITGMEGVRGRAVEFLGDQPEVRGAARLEHADDHPVFLAHPPHDLPDRVELAQLAGDVALDVLEFLLLGAGVEGQRAAVVVAAVDLRRMLAAALEEVLADPVVPFDRIQHADRRLRLDDAIGQGADDLLIVVLRLALAHRQSHWVTRWKRAASTNTSELAGSFR